MSKERYKFEKYKHRSDLINLILYGFHSLILYSFHSLIDHFNSQTLLSTYQ